MRKVGFLSLKLQLENLVEGIYLVVEEARFSQTGL